MSDVIRDHRRVIERLLLEMPDNPDVIELDRLWRRDFESHELYRVFDSEGTLLYIGVSINAINRLTQHKKSPWFGSIASVQIEKLPNREQAEQAERLAIISERPLYNKTWVQLPIGINPKKAVTAPTPYNPGAICPKCVAWRSARRDAMRKWRAKRSKEA